MSFRFLTAGESHGKALVGILEGLPAGVPVTEEEIHTQLKRRKLGYGRSARQKMETDAVEILSGVRFGVSLGSPISLMIQNVDWKNWQEIMSVSPISGEVQRQLKVPRPGHADLVGGFKYQHSDMRNVLERASARETAMRVALGSVARRFLQELGVQIGSRVVRIGGVSDLEPWDRSVNQLNEVADSAQVRCTHSEIDQKMVQEIDLAKKEGNSLGGEFEVIADGLPIGLGSYVQWDRRLEGDLAKSVMSLNAIKGVEVGLGFETAKRVGSLAHDEIRIHRTEPFQINYLSNRTGGIVGGMSTGQPLVIRAAMKPLATLMRPLESVNLQEKVPASAHVERSDVCAVPAAAVIGESLVALVLAEAVLEKFGGDHLEEVKERVESWKKRSFLA